MAKKTVRLDGGYLNAFTMRGRMTNYSAEMMSGNIMLAQPVLQSLYVHNGMARLICDKPAEEMTRAGFTLEGLPEERQKAIEARFEELDAMKKFATAIKWRRAFGGALIIVGIKDGGNLESPLEEDSAEGVSFLRVLDRYEATVNTRYTDANDAKFGEVEMWQITPHVGGVGSYRVHESRCIVFDGESLPTLTRISNDGWGASVLQSCLVQLMRLGNGHKWAELLLERMQQAVHKIPNLSQQVDTAEGESLIQKRLQVVDMVRGIMNTVTIDGEEEYNITSMTLSGVNDVLDRMLRMLSAVTGIPAYILGENITGLNSGSSNKEGWYAQILAWQNEQLRKPIDKLVTWLMREDSEGASDGGEYTIKFNPLFTPTDSENAEINYKEAQTFQVYMNAGVADSDEVRENVSKKYNWTGPAPEPEPEPEPDPLILNEGQRVVPHPNATTKPPVA